MALARYTDVYTTYMFSKRVTAINSELNSLINGDYFNTLKSEVIHEIRNVKAKEQQIYKLLKLEDESIDGLNARLDEYKNAVINLSGYHLNEEIIYILRNQADKKYQFYKQKINEIIQTDIIDKVGMKINDKDELTFAQACLGFLNNEIKKIPNVKIDFPSGNRFFYSERGMDNLAKELLYSGITPQQRKAWKEIVDNRFEIEVQELENSTKTTFNWLEVTKNWTPTEAKKPEHNNEIDKINDEIIEKFKQLCPQDPLVIEQIIRDIVLPGRGKYAFFVGENINDIIGICGEIQGIYYLAKLLGVPKDRSINDIKNDIEWRGGIIDEGAKSKPHQDILLKEFGIQIKNSLKEDFHEINFSQASIEYMIDKAGLSGDVKNLLLNYYGTLHFNVPYKYNRKKDEYLHSKEPMQSRYKKQYLSSLNELRSAERDINILLSMCASAFMYIDVSESELTDTNTLYLLGGSAFVAASDILLQILSEIEAKERSFKVTSDWKDYANTRTIVEALNDNEKYNETYSEMVINSILLTSAFNFGSLDELYHR